jgi:uncharacterized protein (DUF1499 family)
MASRIGVIALALFAFGPLSARLGILPAMAGFILFALGGLLGIVTLVWGAVVGVRGGGFGAALLGLAVTAAFVAVALPGRSYPPYNDYTTDPADPPAFVKAREIPANAGRDMRYPGGAVTEAQRRAYPDLGALDLPDPPGAAFARVRAAARAMPDWEITFEDPAAGFLEGVATTALFRFRDDFVVRVRPRDGGSRVDMRSKSRDGRGDIGANAKRIRAFWASLTASGR